MATIQDIFDWLNQGAQGDIPGTGPQGAASAAADQATAADYPRAYPAPSSVAEGQQGAYASQAADKAIIAGPTPGAFSTTATPQDFAGDMQAQYDALIKAGVPPGLAHAILMQSPSQQQGQKSQTGDQKKEGGLQGSPGYQAGHEAGMGLDQLFFGKPQQQSQQQAQTQPGLFDWLGSWFNSPQSDWSQ